jgi:hypothetical protein
VCNQNPGRRVLNDAKLGPYVLPAYDKQLQGNINHGREGKCMIAINAILPLAAAHVPILAGTDAGNPGNCAGRLLACELEYLVEVGLTPLEALSQQHQRAPPLSASQIVEESRRGFGTISSSSTATRPRTSELRETSNRFGKQVSPSTASNG